MKKLYIIDGSSFLYRAYYGLRPMHTSKGEPVQAVYGFCRMIKKLLDTHKPENMLLVWDSKGKTERHELYPEYKATRQAPPSDLFVQKERIVEFAQAIGLAQLAQTSIEADDLMYSVAHHFAQQDIRSVIITSDKDIGQALSEYVEIFDPFKDEFVTQATLEQKYGFPLHKLPFYFALIGDSSDNIPGVTGIGPKGALDLVTQFDSLEDLYNNIDQVKKERTRELLITSRDNAFLSQKLFTLHVHKISLKLDDCVISMETWPQARELFAQLEFKSLLKDLPVVFEQQTFLEQKSALAYNYICVVTQTQLAEVCAHIHAAGACAVDTETTGIITLQSHIVGVSLAVHEGTAYYIPFGHVNEPAQLPKHDVLEALRPILEDTKIKKYLQNSKFDQLMFAREGIELRGLAFDTMIAASLVTKDTQRINLKALSEQYLNETMITYAELVQKHKTHNFAQIPLEDAVLYAAADAHQTLRLVPILQKELDAHGQRELFETIELPLVDVLYRMEKAGIYCDINELQKLDVIVSKQLAALQDLIAELVGPAHAQINLNSPKQLETLLFEVLALPKQKKTAGKTGYSTDQEVLQELAKLHPVPTLIIKYRELFKLKSTYIDTLGEYINPHTQRIHTHFSQTVVATGRLASSEPNLQNIPLSTDELSIRAAFKAPPGHVFISVDYSQIELRVLAQLSQDATLRTAFAQGQDIHARTAAGLFDIPVSAVSHEQRQLAKRINFSILYGLTPYGLSKDLDIPFAQAKEYIEKYFAQFPGVVTFIDATIEYAKQHGYVTTWKGRRRYVPGIYEKNKSLYELACRIAVNTVAQGTAAELMKVGMLLLQKTFDEQPSLNAQMILQIHDELLISVPESSTAIIEKMVVDVLQNSVNWDVPLVVTTRVGKTWDEVTK